MFVEKGHSFRMDTILGTTKSPVAKHALPLTVISPTLSKAVPVKYTRTSMKGKLIGKSVNCESPTVSPTSDNCSTLFGNTLQCVDDITRKRRLSEDDDRASVSSLDSGRSTPDGSDSGANDRKKSRTSFSAEQVHSLEQFYQKKKYVNSQERAEIADSLTLSQLQVKTWFQNRRMKERRGRSREGHPTFPTGGVDVSKLQALGLPCPPAPSVTTAKCTDSECTPTDLSLPKPTLKQRQECAPSFETTVSDKFDYSGLYYSQSYCSPFTHNPSYVFSSLNSNFHNYQPNIQFRYNYPHTPPYSKTCLPNGY